MASTKKTGLGKGLDALFNSPFISNVIEDESINIDAKKNGEIDIKFIKVNDIEPNKKQARKIFDEESLEELANSIKEYGVIQPIIVSKKDKYYEIVAGERRWRASKKAGIETIPAIVRDDDNKSNMEISLIENIQREDLNPIEKARGIKQLMEEYNFTQNQVAEKLGKSRSAIANTVRLLNLDERVIELALEGKLSEGHCRTILSIDDHEKQYETALKLIDTGASVRQAEKKVKVGKKNKKIDKYEPIYKNIEETFEGFFGTKVKLDPGARKGKIIIQYNSNDDLERMMELLK